MPHFDSNMELPETITFGCFFAGLDAPGRAGKELALLNPQEIQWENAFAVEYEKTICTSLEETLDRKQIKHAKVEDVTPGSLAPIDILWLSPPCDRFTCNSKSDGDRQMFAALPYIRHHQPRIVLMEQVKMIIWKKKKKNTGKYQTP